MKTSRILTIALIVFYIIMTIVYEAGNYTFYDKKSQIPGDQGGGLLPSGIARWFHSATPGIGLAFLICNFLVKRCGSRNCTIGWAVANLVIGAVMFVLVSDYYKEYQNVVLKCGTSLTCPDGIATCWWVALVGLSGVILMQMLAGIELGCLAFCKKKDKKSKKMDETQNLTQHTVVHLANDAPPAPATAWGSSHHQSRYTDDDLQSLKRQSGANTFYEPTPAPAPAPVETRRSAEDDLASRYSGAAYADLDSNSNSNSNRYGW
eukprot:TRINITY_DN14479_c0_g1_i1.p1 TRINITY_DN14479_c0_g1~~TRINITY_DN14479_c0_g1_i1.p1  ORF type:complete len:263 (-),score=44.67 TRINITY_DN14479_c0_g1_i1:104-892(-)